MPQALQLIKSLGTAQKALPNFKFFDRLQGFALTWMNSCHKSKTSFRSTFSGQRGIAVIFGDDAHHVIMAISTSSQREKKTLERERCGGNALNRPGLHYVNSDANPCTIETTFILCYSHCCDISEGGKYFDFRRTAVFGSGHRFSKHKTTNFLEFFWGDMAPLATPGYAYAF